ncbi:MAG: restriction endonuclease [Proteobacteria bacterium]|nr:restriction endonuclease [Pseudomonadota bacterium]
MNHWTQLSIDFANQRDYLDKLFRVYPTIPEDIREIDPNPWQEIEDAFNEQDKITLLKKLLSLDLFPIKDSYVAYLKRDRTALGRNPATVNRLYGRLREMGLDKILEKCTEPKETNRQIGPLFRRWLRKRTIGVPVVNIDAFDSIQGNVILDASDNEMMNYAKEHFGYEREKGLDFIAKFNGKYVIGEAKFLTDFGGHQNAQFSDAISTLQSNIEGAIKIGILDGVLYIKSGNKMYREITTTYSEYNIMSVLVLREFLYQI